MSAKTKRALTVVALVVAAFILFTDPTQAASYVRAAFNLLLQAGEAIVTFLQSLT